MKKFKEFLSKPIAQFTCIIALVMFTLSITSVFTLSHEHPANFGNKFLSDKWSLSSFILDSTFAGYLPALILLGYLGYRTYKHLKKGSELPMAMTLIWSLVLGISMGGGLGEYIKYSKEQAKAQERADEEAEAVAQAVATCQQFPGEQVCKRPAPLKRDKEWSTRVKRCFTTQKGTAFMFLPEECNSFGGFMLDRLISVYDLQDKEPTFTPITPPAILADQVREGEDLAKAVTSQSVITAGEFWAVEHYPKIEIAFQGLGNIFGPEESVSSAEEREKEIRASFIKILRGELESEVKTEIENDLGVRVGLSQQLDKLSEDELRSVGLVIGFYNSLLHAHSKLREKVKAKAKVECAKYPVGTLRPTRCAALEG